MSWDAHAHAARQGGTLWETRQRKDTYFGFLARRLFIEIGERFIEF